MVLLIVSVANADQFTIGDLINNTYQNITVYVDYNFSFRGTIDNESGIFFNGFSMINFTQVINCTNCSLTYPNLNYNSSQFPLSWWICNNDSSSPTNQTNQTAFDISCQNTKQMLISAFSIIAVIGLAVIGIALGFLFTKNLSSSLIFGVAMGFVGVAIAIFVAYYVMSAVYPC